MISSTAIGTSNTNIYTVPAGQSHAVVLMILCNTNDSNARTVTVYAVRSGQSPSNTNMIINDLTIPAGDTRIFNLEKLLLNGGDRIVARANATGVSATFSVMQL